MGMKRFSVYTKVMEMRERGERREEKGVNNNEQEEVSEGRKKGREDQVKSFCILLLTNTILLLY